MANTLPFKCYLLTNNGQDKEIRRFALESDVVGNFTYLKEKVRAVYPQLLRENFSLCYIDEEGDKVTISSDDELVSALMFVKRKDDEPFRLIIQTSGGPKPETNSATSTATTGNCQGEIHWGVTCDGCQGAVKGFRYKCFQCPDFDLCGKCETAGMHPGHPLIRVTGPMPASFQAMKQVLAGGSEVPHWRRKHHGRFHHQGHHGGWNAWCPSGINVEIDPQTKTEGCKKESSKPDAKQQCPYKFYMEQAKETASNIQTNHPEYLMGLSNTIASVMEGLGFGSVGRSCPRESAQKTEEKQENVGKAETKTEASPPKTEVKKEVIIPVTVEKEVPTKVPEVNPYAQVADAIAAARAAELANAQSFADFANQAAAVVEVKVAPIEAMLAAQAAEARAAAAQAAEAKAVAQAAAEAAARAAAQAAAEAAAQAAEEARKQTPSPQPTTTPQQSPSRDSGDWTIVDDVEKSNASAAAAANLGARPKSPPQQPLVEKAPLHPDPFIAAALETMLAMGFTNEGGWLSQLLEVKGGDIGKALDVLQSRFQRQQH